MNLFTVIGLVGVGMVIFTGLFALLVTRLDAAVIQNNEDMDAGKTRYRPANTMGFNIAQDADKTGQFLDARQEAAKAAARSARGSNMRIGRKGAEHGKTASDELTIDPISAFKIATTQGWKGLGDFAKAQASAVGASAAPVAAAGATKMVKRKLVPGKDFEVIEITAGMSGPERRSARASNGKAKYAAYKAAKASGADMAVAAAPVAAAPAAAAPSAGDQAAAAGIEEPVLIELTDDMEPAEKRAARIANSKAKSAYKKALKAAGISASAAAAAPPAEAAAPAAAPAPVAEEAPAGLDDIPKPDLIEMTDDMDPSEKRAARIANSKAKSAYKKALKAAGIDPKSVKM